MRLVLLLFWMFTLGLVGQGLPNDTESLLKALEDRMSNGMNDKDIKEFMKGAEDVMMGTTFQAIKDSFVVFGNQMEKKRMRSAHYEFYVRTAVAFSKRPNTTLNVYHEWLPVARHVLKEESPSVFQKFLEFSEQYFAENILYQSSGHTWSFSGDAYLSIQNGEVTVEGPKVDLHAKSQHDQTVIEGTHLWYLPLEEEANIEGGRMYYDRNELARDKVYAELNRVNLNMRRTTFTADSVMFVHQDYFSEPLMGSFEEKLTATGEHRDSRYPKFDSYSKRFRMEDIRPDVDYEGGFSFYGTRFIAKGTPDLPAYLYFKRQGEVFLKTASTSYSIGEERLASQEASVTMYLEEDSIFHPGLQIKFLAEERELSLLRIGDGSVQTPFFNTYHKVDMFFEALYWRMDQDFIRISMAKGSAENKAVFQSANYYSEVHDERLRGLDHVHPVTVMFNFLKANDMPKKFKAIEFSKYMKTDPHQVRLLLIRMSIIGLISYESETQTVTVRERLYDYYFARAGLKDFDVISFESVINNDNARLSLKDYRLDLAGVARITLSDSQAVFIYPENQKVELRKNRDFSFSGVIEAGKFGIFGKDFDFNYDLFKVTLTNVDSVKMAVKSFTKNEMGLQPLRFVRTVIEDLRGELLVDAPGNKSGVKSMSEYPRLISERESYTYYDRPEIEGGVYKRDQVYFKLDPFTLDSLDNFQTEQIQLKGTFVSNIFPDLKEKLSVQKDYSLGFERVTGEEGLPAYGGKGTFKDTLSLSHKGIRGGGQLEYLTSQMWSTDFKFYLDSMNTMAYKFGIKKSKGAIETPDVKAQDVYVHWEPQNDKLEAKDSGKPLEMYEGETVLTGKVTLSPAGLTGDGLMDFGTAEMESEIFQYKADDFRSDTTSFALKDQIGGSDTANVALRTDNVNSDVTFVGRKGIFRSNSDETYVDFPMNDFKAYMEELEWYMDRNEVDMNSERVDDLGLKGALFVSTDPKMDSLAFVAPIAKFVNKSKTIFCEGVEYIDIADSRIKPDDKKVSIQRNAVFDPIPSAEVWIGKEERRHVLKNATIQMHTSHRYTGSGDYTYVDEMGKGQTIHLHTIDCENDVTVAEGKVEQIADFSMSPHFGFKGNVKLRGDEEFLTFDGYVKIMHSCSNMQNEWLRFETEIDPNNILIPIPADPKNDDNIDLYNGFLFASDSTGLYPAIFSAKHSFSDYEVLKVDGFLKYDKKNREFRVGTMEKLENRMLPGPYLSFHTGNCTSYGEGRMDLGSKMGQVELKAAGNIRYYPDADSTELNLTMSIHFPFPPSMLVYIAEELKKINTMGINLRDQELQKDLSGLLDSTAAEKAFSEITPEGLFKRMPKELERTLVLDDVKLSWSKAHRALQFEGTSGVLVFNEKQSLKTLPIMMDLNRKPAGDQFSLYLEIDSNNWYYFQYKSGIMQTYSNQSAYTDILRTLDVKDRQFIEKNTTKLTVTPSSKRRVDRFKSKFGKADEDPGPPEPGEE